MRLFLLVILLISNLCFSQNQSVIDSLKNEIKYTETTEKDIELYQLLSKYYSKIEPNFDSAFDYKLAYYLSINHKHETEGKTDSLFIMSKKISNYIDSMKNIGYDKIDSNGLVFASYFNLANSYKRYKQSKIVFF